MTDPVLPPGMSPTGASHASGQGSPSAPAEPTAAAVKRRQVLLLAGIAGTIVAGTLLSVSLTGTKGNDAPPAKPQGPRGNVLVQLRPKGDRRLEGVLESPSNGQGAEVRVGDEVVLADATWPSSALGTRIGTVESAGPLDSNPLRRSVVVRMDCDPTRLGEDVIVKVRDVEGGRR